MVSIEQDKVLQMAVNSGIIDMSSIQVEVEKMERKKLLRLHQHSIWQGRGGYWYTYLDGSQIKRKSQRKLEDCLVEYYRNQVESPPFETVFYEWVKKKLSYGEIQRQTYDNYIREYESLIGKSSLSTKRMREISEEWLEDFIKSTISDHRLTSKRWGNLRVIISGTVKYAKKRGYTDISMRVFLDELDLSTKIFRHKLKADSDQVFTKEEICKIKNYILAREPSIVELGVLLAIETGMRRGEIAALKKEDIEDDYIHVCRTEIRYKDASGKTVFDIRESTKGRDGERKVVLTEFAKEVLEKAKSKNSEGQYVFEKNGTWVKGHSFTKRIQDICKMVGIKSRSMHKLRKTYATNLLNNHVDEKLITMQMGHTEISTTKDFYYYNNRNSDECKKIIQTALA